MPADAPPPARPGAARRRRPPLHRDPGRPVRGRRPVRRRAVEHRHRGRLRRRRPVLGGRLAPRWRHHPFVCAGLPVLLAGGVGGTLYHATRTRRAYFLLDVIPISLLGVAGSVYLTVRLGRSLGAARTAAVAAAVAVAYLAVNGVLLRVIEFDSPNLRINLSYASLALLVLLPVLGVLVRTRFRHGAWVAAALASFAVAWFCRLVDNTGLSTLPMGTHWLWHVFGAVTTQAMIAYFVAVEGGDVPLTGPPGSPAPPR